MTIFNSPIMHLVLPLLLLVLGGLAFIAFPWKPVKKAVSRMRHRIEIEQLNRNLKRLGRVQPNRHSAVSVPRRAWRVLSKTK